MYRASRGSRMNRAFRVFFLFAFVVLVGAVAFSQQQQSPPPPPPDASAAPGQQQAPTIHTRVSEVDMILSVVNHRQKFIVDLEKSDFRVLEDNHEQKIEFFSRQTDLP